VVTVREVQARNVHARIDELDELIHCPAGGANRADDLRVVREECVVQREEESAQGASRQPPAQRLPIASLPQQPSCPPHLGLALLLIRRREDLLQANALAAQVGHGERQGGCGEGERERVRVREVIGSCAEVGVCSAVGWMRSALERRLRRRLSVRVES